MLFIIINLFSLDLIILFYLPTNPNELNETKGSAGLPNIIIVVMFRIQHRGWLSHANILSLVWYLQYCL